jgi:hypothetical protein
VNFTGATSVKFNGTSATYTVNSSSQITATVPEGATTGTISVLTVSGLVTSATPFTVIPPRVLDTLSLAADYAFSPRLLRSAYGGSNNLVIRRSSDNATQAFGFNGINRDDDSILAFVGSGDGFLDTYYSQQGGFNVSQSDHTKQPKVVSSGSIITVDGKPAIQFTTETQLTVTIPSPENIYQLFLSAVAQLADSASGIIVYEDNLGSRGYGFISSSGNRTVYYAGYSVNGFGAVTNNIEVWGVKRLYSGVNSYYVNGALIRTDSAGMYPTALEPHPFVIGGFNGYLFEIIGFHNLYEISDTDRATVTTNQTNYYL